MSRQLDLFVRTKEEPPLPLQKTCKRRGYKTERAAMNSTYFLSTKDRMGYGSPFYCATCCKYHLQLRRH